MKVYALASGSSGNAYLFRTDSGALLVEAGLPASKLTRFLVKLGLDPRSLTGILLTHAHSDHRQGARELSDRYAVPIFATAGTLGHASLRDSPLARPLRAGQVVELGSFEVRPFAVPHDCAEPVGFRIGDGAAAACLATDLGHVPPELPAFLEGTDLLVLEANHDEEMLWSGPYPPFLKRRVAGTHGHLSNVAAATCISQLRKPPAEVWLAHLSRVNNQAAHALDVVRATLRGRGLEHVDVLAAGRNSPSLSWESAPRVRQLALW